MCLRCRRRGQASFWPLTFDFWDPRLGMSNCRACIRELARIRVRRKYHEDAEYRARTIANTRAWDEVKRFKRRLRIQHLRENEPEIWRQKLDERNAYDRERRARKRQEKAA